MLNGKKMYYYLPMTFSREIQLLFNNLTSSIFATSNDMQMYHACDLRKISESVQEKSEWDIQNGDDIDHINKRQFFFAEENFRSLSWCMSYHRSQIGVLMFVL